jgi:hypothetical protein
VPSGPPRVTTPTPIGGIPPAPSVTPTPEVTATPEVAQIQPTDTPTLQAPSATPTPSPTAQRLAAVPKETSRPLLDVSAARSTSVPSTAASRNRAPDSRLALYLGAGTLVAAAILGALALLIWLRRAR